MTQTRDLIKKMADFFTGEEFYKKGEDARLELSPDDVRCMNEVIKACGNAISREDTLKAMIEQLGIRNEDYLIPAEETLYKVVKNMPSATPQSKIGRWIFVDKAYEHAHCSECDYGNVDLMDGRPHNYCPNCGAKMQEVEE